MYSNFVLQSTFMNKDHKYIRDITEIRSMMERSTKFLSLTGWSGIMAGIYALLGAFVAYKFLHISSQEVHYDSIPLQELSNTTLYLFLLAFIVLLFAVGTAVVLSWKKSTKNGERLWNAASRRLVINLAIPLLTGGIFILTLIAKQLWGLIAPVTLIFYGLALINASKFTYEEVKYFGIIEIVLGLIASYFIGYGLLLWALGFDIMHIVYGVYMHLRYEK